MTVRAEGLRLDRRFLLSGLVSAGIARARPAAAAFPDTPRLLVAGPRGGRIDRWAELIAAPLGRHLLQGAAVGRENVGGIDGVTGANQFQARATPDGSTALLIPGVAAMAWLVGDSRVRFDVGGWAPLWGGEVCAAVASQAPLVAGQPVRVGVTGIVGPDLALLLALELMGIPATAVPVTPAAEHGPVDVELLRGDALRRELALGAGQRRRLRFSLGLVGADGTSTHDPVCPNLPLAHELIARRQTDRPPELLAAFTAVTAAATLDFGLVLPLISPAAVVAWWRQGCAALSTMRDIQREATQSLVQPAEAGAMAASVERITADPPVLLALRRWLAERHQFRPG